MPASASRIAASALLTVAVLAIVVRLAWVSDDAYITLRVVENVLDGHGPVWNVGERVQTFTHPLWMMLLTASRALLGAHFAATLLLSFALTAAFVFTLLARAGGAAAMSLLLACLLSCRAFGDYATSGLETPLTMVLVASFHGVLRCAPERRLLACAVLTALLMLTRLDLCLLAAPALAWSFFQVLRTSARRAVRLAITGAAPLFAWEAFSIFYYGSAVPITAYAKALAPGIATGSLIEQGCRYVAYTATHDPATVAVTAAGITVALLRGDARARMLALGGVLYIAYVVKVGGDFMAGRFFVPPLATSLCLLASAARASGRAGWLGAGAAAALALGFVAGPPPYLLPVSADLAAGPRDNGIGDERRVYYRESGLLSPHLDIPLAGETSRRLRAAGRDRPLVMKAFRAGKGPFHGGDLFHYLDTVICDPMLSRLPVPDPDHWRIGHFARAIPAGYLESLAADDDRLQHDGLARYYEDLRAALRAPLWSADRLSALGRLLTGSASHGLSSYVTEAYRNPRPRPVEVAQLIPAAWPDALFWFDDPRVVTAVDHALSLRLAGATTTTRLRLLVTPLCDYRLTFCSGGREVARHTLSTPVALPSADPEADALDYLYQVSGMRTFAVELPTETTFDEVLVTTRPLTGLVVPAVGGLLTGP